MGTFGVGQGAIGQGGIGGTNAPGGGGGGGGGGGNPVKANAKRNSAGEIAFLAKWLVGDPNSDYSTEAFVCPGIQIAQDSLVNCILQNPNISRLTFAIELVNVPLGTTDLSAYFQNQATGDYGPLALLKEVVSMREKPTGADKAKYQDMTKVNDLPVRSVTGYNANFVWTGDNILLPGATQALDLRIWGKFDPAEITSYDVPVIANIKSALVAVVAVNLAEGHDNDKKYTRLVARAELESFNLLNNIMLELQFEETRPRAYGELSGTLE